MKNANLNVFFFLGHPIESLNVGWWRSQLGKLNLFQTIKHCSFQPIQRTCFKTNSKATLDNNRCYSAAA